MRNLWPLVVFASALGLTGQAQAGAAPARLTCVTAAAKSPTYRIEATIPRDIYDFRMHLQGPAGATILDESNATVDVLEDFPKGVFSLVVSGYEPHLSLYALPATIKRKSIPNGFEARFDAVLVGAPEPGAARAGSDKPSISGLPISCVYHYAI